MTNTVRIAWMTAATACSICACVPATQKSIQEYSTLAIDAGLLASWIPYAISDIACWRYDSRTACKISATGAYVSFGMMILCFFAALIGGQWTTPLHPETADSLIFGSFLSILVTCLAMTIGLTSNALINFFLVGKTGQGFTGFSVRAIISTTISQFCENLLLSLAIPAKGWTITQSIGAAAVGSTLELAIEIFMLPVIYKLAKQPKETQWTTPN